MAEIADAASRFDQQRGPLGARDRNKRRVMQRYLDEQNDGALFDAESLAELERLAVETAQAMELELDAKMNPVDETREYLAVLPLEEDRFFKIHRESRTLENYNVLLRVHALKGSAESAQAVFDSLRERCDEEPDAMAYNSLMKAYAKEGNVRRVLDLFEEIQGKPASTAAKGSEDALVSTQDVPVKLDAAHYGVLIDAYAEAGDVDGAARVLRQLQRSHQEWVNLAQRAETPEDRVALPKDYLNPVHFTAVIRAQWREGRVSEAWDTYYSMNLHGVRPDPIAYNVMMRICADTHEAEKAVNLFDELRHRGFLPLRDTFNSLIYCLAKRHDYYKESFRYFLKMVELHVRPDEYTLHAMLHACSTYGDLANARTVSAYFEEFRIPKTRLTFNLMLRVIGASIKRHPEPLDMGVVDFPAPDGSVQQAPALLTVDDRLDLATDVLVQMQHLDNVSVGLDTVNSYLNVLCISGKRAEAERAFRGMFRKFALQPDVLSYAPMLKMYVRMRDSKSADEILDLMLRRNLRVPKRLFKLRLLLSDDERDWATSSRVLKLMEDNGHQVKPYDKYIAFRGQKLQDMERDEVGEDLDSKSRMDKYMSDLFSDGEGDDEEDLWSSLKENLERDFRGDSVAPAYEKHEYDKPLRKRKPARDGDLEVTGPGIDL